MQVRKQSKESCGNDGAVESVESQKQAFPSFHSSLEISPKAGEIPTFPQLRLRRGGKVEKQNQLSHFPAAFSLSLKTNRRAGFTHRPPRGSFYLARLGIFLFGLDRVKNT
jgi:hypothetical protein